MNTYVMAIDQGTTSSRAILFDHRGGVVASSQKEITQYFPEQGWVEHDANEIWNSVQSVMANCLIESGLQPHQIVAIGITNQRETTVVWDKITGLPIYHAVVWQSKQSANLANQLKEEGLSDFIHEKTGLLIDSYFSATKIRWILDHVPGSQQRAEKGELLFGTIDSWLVYKLTNGQRHVTDYTNASRTMLFNIHDLTWDKEILERLSIPSQMLPKVCSNSEIYGLTRPYHFFGYEVPIAGMAGDQQAALFGQLAFEPGMMKNTYGTGAFLVMNTGKKALLSHHQLLTTIGYGINGQVHYALEGSIFVAGSAVQWLRDGLSLFEKVSKTQAMAYQSQGDHDVVVVPAFVGLGAPYWDQDVRGAVFGLTRGTTKEDLVKATLEGIAYQVKDIIEVMKEDTNIDISALMVDGGASRNDYLMQFQADILGLPVHRVANHETTALGAAFLAGLAVGYWKDMDELKGLVQAPTVFEVQMESKQAERLYDRWQKAVQAARSFK